MVQKLGEEAELYYTNHTAERTAWDSGRLIVRNLAKRLETLHAQTPGREYQDGNIVAGIMASNVAFRSVPNMYDLVGMTKVGKKRREPETPIARGKMVKDFKRLLVCVYKCSSRL